MKHITTPKTARNYLYISTFSALEKLCKELEDNYSWLAIDTEFVRVDTYFPELSLVQLATEDKRFFIIDPLAIRDSIANSENALTPLVDLLSSENICKVFHSTRQDIEVLFQLENRLPQNLFDTQIAAIFFGQGDIAGFARVIESQLGIKLEKSQTRTNWHARPLSEEQIEYALDDVDYLVDLYQHFVAQLNPEQIHAITDDCQQLLDANLYITDPSNAWKKIKGTKNFKPKQLAIVQSLAEWREIYAIENNQPKKWTISDEVIVQIAKRPPKTAQALYKVPSIKASSVKEFGDTWIELIDEVFASNSETYPTPEQKITAPTDSEEIILTLLQALALQIALDHKININNLFHKSELLALIRGEHFPQSGWRNYLFFSKAQALMEGKLQLSLQNHNLVTRPTTIPNSSSN